jgi:hypothetical protein
LKLKKIEKENRSGKIKEEELEYSGDDKYLDQYEDNEATHTNQSTKIILS